MDMDVIIGCCIFLGIVGYLVYAKPWKNKEFVEVAADEQEAKAAVEEVKGEEVIAVVVVPEPEPVVVSEPESVKEEAPVVVVEPEDAPKPKRGRKGKN